MTLIAISASYGAGGSRIGPAVAKRLGVPFVDRAIPMGVAERLSAPLDDATAYDENPGSSWLERILRGFIGSDTGAPTPLPPDAFSSEDFRRATEEVLLRQAEAGSGVILGRAAVIVLRDAPAVLRVRLDGPPERRIRQAVRLQGVDEPTAERAMRQFDRTHEEYARHLYGVDLHDLSLYHLVVDSTAIELGACVELIATAAGALRESAGTPA
jgi:cytidylate kinase